MADSQTNTAAERSANAARDTADFQAQLEAWDKNLALADRRLRAALRERPLLALGTAVLAGFVAGRILRRI